MAYSIEKSFAEAFLSLSAEEVFRRKSSAVLSELSLESEVNLDRKRLEELSQRLLKLCERLDNPSDSFAKCNRLTRELLPIDTFPVPLAISSYWNLNVGCTHAWTSYFAHVLDIRQYRLRYGYGILEAQSLLSSVVNDIAFYADFQNHLRVRRKVSQIMSPAEAASPIVLSAIERATSMGLLPAIVSHMQCFDMANTFTELVGGVDIFPRLKEKADLTNAPELNFFKLVLPASSITFLKRLLGQSADLQKVLGTKIDALSRLADPNMINASKALKGQLLAMHSWAGNLLSELPALPSESVMQELAQMARLIQYHVALMGVMIPLKECHVASNPEFGWGFMSHLDSLVHTTRHYDRVLQEVAHQHLLSAAFRSL